MRTVNIAGLAFHQGPPKICVPLTEARLPALLEEAAQGAALPADLYEWRMDGYLEDLGQALSGLGPRLAGKPLLCTLRTQGEGGACGLDPQGYEEALSALLDKDGFQLVDIELSCGEERVGRLIRKARSRGIATVVSKHDFQKTPPPGEVAATLLRMAALGADLPKYAVMPHTPQDVLDLLQATLQASREAGPVVTMAMGPLGKLSRVAGGVSGCCMTFGAGRNASAPGQLDAEDLRAILQDLDPRA